LKLIHKLKRGASKAADAAQLTMELTKIAGQIGMRRKEIEKCMTMIGKEVFEAREAGQPALAEARIEEWCRTVRQLKREISDFERRLRTLRKETVCVCGRTSPADAKFCPSCGRRLPAPAARVIDVDPEEER